MWTSPSSSNSIPFSSSSSYAILGNDTNSSNSRLHKPMEEIWNDITLSSLHPGNNSSRGMILQDFFGKDPPHSAVDASPPPPPPPTVLSLSSRQEQYFNGAPLGLHPQDHRGHVSSHVSPLVLPFEGRVSDESPGCGNKRFPDLGGSSVDRHHKRMIKNRESAARSRARKQAYTNELELEVAHLLEENARLKKQQQQLNVAPAADTHRNGKKKTLQRSSTAPF